MGVTLTFEVRVILALVQAAPGGVWPVTVAGWGTLIGVALGFVFQLIAMGKFLEKLNGFGTRVNDMEKKLSGQEALQHAATLANQRLVDAQASLLKEIGHAHEASAQCGRDNDTLRSDIISRLDSMSKEAFEGNTKVRERLAAVEQAMRMRGDAESQNRK